MMSHFNVAVFSRTPDEVETLLEPFCEDVTSDSPYAEFEEQEDADLDEASGKRGYWRNPNAQWDWYVIGGRWTGYLKLKEGRTGTYGKPTWPNEDVVRDPTRCDHARVGDCDFSQDQKAYKAALRVWEVKVEGKPLRMSEKPETFDLFYKPEYYLNRYGTKEAYADAQSRFSVHSFVTADGEWFEQGRMGWFGMDDATAESRSSFAVNLADYLREAEAEDLYITIVDCHI